MKRLTNNRIRARGFVIALAFILMPSAFLFLHLITPSDGARLEPGDATWRSNGVVVTPLDERTDGLQKGDLVIAAAGHSLEYWAEHSLDLTIPRAAWSVGDKVPYTVIRSGQTVDVAVSLVRYPLAEVFLRNWSTFVGTLFCQVIFALVFLFKPGDRAVRMLFFWAWSFVWLYSWSIGLQVGDLINPLGLWVYRIGAMGGWLLFWSADLAFMLLFPKPHPMIQRYPRILAIVFVAPIIVYMIFIMLARSGSASVLEWEASWTVGDWFMAVAYQLLALIVIARGYRSYYDAVARQRTRLLLFGFALGTGLNRVLWIIPSIVMGRGLISSTAVGLAIIPFPTALAIAVSRRQVFDIDIIIRRTLIYTVLTALLALLYFCGIVVLKELFHAVTGQGSDLAIIVSTLGIASLFVPLRRRVQGVIDLRLYRRKYDAQKVLSSFGTTVRDEMDLNRLSDAVVEGTMQPERASIWLRETDSSRKS